MFTKPLALFLFPALAAVAQNYGGPPAGPASSSAPSATSSAVAVAPTAPASTSSQMNVCASFLACSDTYTDKFVSRLTLRFRRLSHSTLQILRHLLAHL